MEIFTREQILSALKKAPRPIQKAFSSEKTTNEISAMQIKYSLHVDTAGTVNNEVGNLLLGLIDPTAFIQRLQEAGIDQNTANSIAQDVNLQIFVPLQKKMREAPANDKDDDEEDTDWTTPEDDVVPIVPVTIKAPMSVMDIGRINDRQPAPVQQAINTPIQQTPAPVLPPQTVAPVTTIHPRTMQQDMQLVQQGNLHDAELGAPVMPITPTPTIIAPVPAATVVTAPPQYAARPQAVASSPYVAPIAPPAWHSSAAASFQTASIPNTAPSELNMPRYTAPPQNQIPPAPEPFVRSTIAAEPQPRSAPSPITKEYGADPYRELLQ